MASSVSTLYKELSLNSNSDGIYKAKSAQRRSKKRKWANRDNPKKIKGQLALYIHEKLAARWSPAQISGRLKLERKIAISNVAIYNYIAKDKDDGGKLYLCLRRKGRKKRDYNKKRSGRSLIPNRVDIDERDPIVDSKTRIGDWAADTVVGKGHKSGIVTLVDRHSKRVLSAKINSFKADHIFATISKMLEKYPHKLHTITFDNGLAFAAHAQLSQLFMGLQTYFAKPYKSWQRRT